MHARIFVALVVFTASTGIAGAIELPAQANFDTGKVLRSGDLKALLQNVLDLKVGEAVLKASSFCIASSCLTNWPFVQTSNNAWTAGADIMRIRSNGPGLYLEETDQAQFREDYGHWRIVADQNTLFFENWERRVPGESEYAQQDEFLSFHRSPTPATSGTGDHIIQWNYDFVGLGARDLTIAANWNNIVYPQVPRTLTISSLNGQNNQLVPALRISPNGATPVVSLPSGPLQVSGTITGQKICIGATCLTESQLKVLMLSAGL